MPPAAQDFSPPVAQDFSSPVAQDFSPVRVEIERDGAASLFETRLFSPHYRERLSAYRERTLPAASPAASSRREAGSGTVAGGSGSIRSVVRIPNVNPCQNSGVGTTHENSSNVPMN